MFQSSPSFEAGRYDVFNVIRWAYVLFQSSPSFEAGRYAIRLPANVVEKLFQSSPSFEAGRYAGLPHLAHDSLVPILTQL